MTDDPEPTPTNDVLWPVLGWLVHVALASGACARLLVPGPDYARTFADYNMALPWLTQQVLTTTRSLAGSDPFTVVLLVGLAAFDLIVLLGLARWERPLWKWWFWGVAVLLILLLLVVEFALYLPMWKLREALSK